MVYETFKKKLISDFEIRRDMLVINESRKEPESLFGVRDENDRLYMRILTAFETIILQNVENLIAELCKRNGIYNFKNSDARCYFDMEIEIKGVRKYVDFKSRPNVFNSSKIYELAHRIKALEQPILTVFLIKDSIESRESVTRFTDKMVELGCAGFESMLFEDFLEDLCGTDEKVAFREVMADFKSEMHKAIGYQITELCSPYNLGRLKEQLEKELTDFDYDAIREKRQREMLSEGQGECVLRNDSFEVIKNTFLGNERYKILLGSSDFAVSFVTSEWLYKKYFSLDELDNTFIVAGYLKSIEQLLWDIILMIGKGRMLRGTVISETTAEDIDKTLGSLQYFLSNWSNDDLFQSCFGTGKHFVMNYLRTQISDWRKQYRNGFFHKHNLKEKDRIEAIREETYFLYFLVLGSIKLTQLEVNRLSQ